MMLTAQVGKAIGKALMPLTGGVGKELSGYLADQIRFLRWKSAVKILDRAKDFCERGNIKPEKVPIKFIIPFLEAASFEDTETDDTLSDMWSALFASAVTSYQARYAAYIDILKKLSSHDAEYIKKFYAKLVREDMYADTGFDPDLWNVNDKQEFVEEFENTFRTNGEKILQHFRAVGFPSGIERYESLINDCAQLSSWRLDITPMVFDLSFYNKEDKTNSTTGPFRSAHKKIDPTINLITLGLMEKFEVVSWYPQRHRKGREAVRVTASVAILNTRGFEFMKACLRKPKKQKKENKSRLSSA
jgi:hypothetical protein